MMFRTSISAGENRDFGDGQLIAAAIQTIILVASQKRNVAQSTIVATIMMPNVIEKNVPRHRIGDGFAVAFSARRGSPEFPSGSVPLPATIIGSTAPSRDANALAFILWYSTKRAMFLLSPCTIYTCA
jgi:hypothetical protein